jgi:hypothetical protein
MKRLRQYILESDIALHPFEKANLGKAPFSYYGFAEAYQDPQSGKIIWTGQEKLKGIDESLWMQCQYCFTGIRNIHVIESADGVRSPIGSECIAKLNNVSLVQKAKKSIEKRDKIRKANKEEIAKNTRIDKNSIWNFVLTALDETPGNFAKSIAQGIRDGHPPKGKAISIVAEIYAKTFGAPGTHAFRNALQDFNDKLQGVATVDTDMQPAQRQSPIKPVIHVDDVEQKNNGSDKLLKVFKKTTQNAKVKKAIDAIEKNYFRKFNLDELHYIEFYYSLYFGKKINRAQRTRNELITAYSSDTLLQKISVGEHTEMQAKADVAMYWAEIEFWDIVGHPNEKPSEDVENDMLANRVHFLMQHFHWSKQELLSV